MRDLATLHAALADQTRLRLLGLMEGGEICVCHLQAVLKTNQPKISRHLAYLRKAGLVEARKDGKWTHYRLAELDTEREKIRAQTLECLKLGAEAKKDLERLGKVRS